MSNSNKVISSAFFSVTAKFLSKLLGLLSTVIIARILTPEDFGFIAIVSMVLYFFDILSHAASEQYLIQKKIITRNEIYSAWTLNIFLKSTICLAIATFSGVIANYFAKSELHSAIFFASLILPLQALKNPKLILFKRQLKFKPIFYLSFSERLFGLPVIVLLATTIKSYWAFIITDIILAIFSVAISYGLAKCSPKLNFSGIKKQWQFSKWMLSKSIVGYIRSQIDTFLVAKYYSPSLLGNYHMARDLSMMPAHYILSPAIEPLLAVFSSGKKQRGELLDDVLFCLLIVIAIAIPLCGLMVIYSEQIIELILGKRWQTAIDLLPVMSFLLLYWSFSLVLETLLLAQRRLRFLFFYDVFSLLMVVAGLGLVISASADVLQVALIRVAVGALSAIVLFLLIFKSNLLKLTSFFLGVVCLLTSVVFSAYVSSYFVEANTWLSEVPFKNFITLLLGGGTFLFIYILTSLFFVGRVSNLYFSRLRTMILTKLPCSAMLLKSY